MRLVARENIECTEWNGFADTCDEAWLWHHYELQSALATWGTIDLSFAVRDENTKDAIVAIFPLKLHHSTVYKHIPWNLLISTGGPAIKNDLGAKHRRKIINFLQEAIFNFAEKHKVVQVDVMLTPLAPAYRGEHCPRVNPLLSFGYENTLTQTWMLDLSVGKDALWDKMETRARTAIRKAQKNEITVRLADKEDDLDIYYDLHTETYTRTGVTPHPKAYFEAIWRDFLPQGYAHIFFAEHQGEVISAENFGVYKDGAVYWTGAGNQRGLELEANSLVQWTAMQWMVEQGVQWYETGEAFLNTSDKKLKGLSDFKRSFGGELFPIYRGRIETGQKQREQMERIRVRRAFGRGIKEWLMPKN